MHSCQVLYLLLAVEVITSVDSHDCPFIPRPITASKYTTVIKVDCRSQRDDDGLGDTTGDSTGVAVYLYNCITVPVGMFVDASANLSKVSVLSEHSEVLSTGTFEGLQNVKELRLEGFRNLSSLSTAVFRPLRNLERLVLVGFGAHKVTYAELGVALYELSGTPLRSIVMHEIHSYRNEKALNITSMFRLQNVSVQELTFSNNIVTVMWGKFSRTLPDLNYMCLGVNARYESAINSFMDGTLFLRSINEVFLYAYPVPYTLNTVPVSPASSVIDTDNLDLETFIAMLPYLQQQNCYRRAKLPLSPTLRRVTVRNMQLLGSVVDKPICFDDNNDVEYIDFAGSPLPPRITPITGLNQLKYFDLQNTGIIELPNDFFRYFPKLERINLVQLSIGETIKHINSNFFGNCPTLKEIHLGDCQLTAIPSTAFELVPSLEILNLSSNSLQTFNANLKGSSNFSRINLSSNALSTLSADVLGELDEIAQRRLQDGNILTIDLRRNPLSCLCNSTHFVRQLQDWVMKRKVNVPGFEEYTCLYSNGSVLAMSEADVELSVTECKVLSEFKNASDCPCDKSLRQRLELVRVSLHGYVCRNSDGQLISMSIYPLRPCPDFFRNATFIAPVVIGGVLALALVVALVLVYRYRKNPRVHRIIQRMSITRIMRLARYYRLAEHREDPNSFKYDVLLYIQDSDQEATEHRFENELSPLRQVLRHDFSAGLKLESLLNNMSECRWLMPVLSPNFVVDGECCDFIARAQFSRPHAIVPVIWTAFHSDNLTIIDLLNTAEPVTWPGECASEVDKAAFWETLLERTANQSTTPV